MTATITASIQDTTESIMDQSEIPPWTKRQFNIEMSNAGWVRESANASSGEYWTHPDSGHEIKFYPLQFRRGFGVMWKYYANRQQTPETKETPF